MFCPKCHKEMPDNAVFCDGCGTKIVLDNSAENESQTAQQGFQAQNFQQLPQQPPFNQQAPQQSFNQQIPQQSFGQQAPQQTFGQQASQQSFGQQAPQQTFGQQAPQQSFGQQIPQQTFGQQPQFGQGAPAYNGAQGVLPARAAKKPFDINALLKNKFVWIGLGAVILIVVLIIILANISSSSSGSFGGITAEKPFAVFETSDGTYIYKADKELASVESKLNYGFSTPDNSVYFYLTSDGEFHVIDGDKDTEIDSDVKNLFAISPDGSTIVYANGSEEVMIYRNGDKKVITEIDSSENEYVGAVRLSPNGDTAVYSIVSRDSDTWEERTVAYIYSGDKAEKLSDKTLPLSVSNGGDIIYATRNGKFGYFKDKNGDEFTSVKSSAENQIFSSDRKSLIFYSGSSTYYFSSSMEDPVKICSGSISLVLPKGSTGEVSTFKDFLAINSGNIYRFVLKGDEFEKTKIVSSSYDYKLSSDGNYIFYLKNGKLRRVDTKTGDDDNEFAEIDGESIEGFIPIQDYSGFYLYDNYNSLYYVGKNGDTVKKPFAEEVYGGVVDDSGVMTYLVDYSGGTGTLYYSSKGDKGKKVEGIGECTSYLYADSTSRQGDSDLTGSTIYVFDEDGVLYISKDGKTFEKTKVEK